MFAAHGRWDSAEIKSLIPGAFTLQFYTGVSLISHNLTLTDLIEVYKKYSIEEYY